MLEEDLSLVSAILIFVASIIPIYLSFKLKGVLQKLTLSLSVFILIHGFYHIFLWVGFDFVSESILEPISAVVLVIFGVVYLSVLKKKREELRT